MAAKKRHVTHFSRLGPIPTGNGLEEQRCTISNANGDTLEEYEMKSEFIDYECIKIFS